MNTVLQFVAKLELGPVFAYPFIATLIVVMAWFAWDETDATDLAE
ncbi:MAG: hypothetical protein JWM78_2188 [Verrucomicrobiaceae bacterium]|nr:hypothetical protein [Verrucomicrobiaceae bacterium]